MDARITIPAETFVAIEDAISQIRVLADALDAERALADSLALALRLSVKYGRPPEQAEEVLARYEEARR